MKKSKICIVIICIMGIALGGCQTAPQKVLDNAKEYGANHNITNNTIVYCDVTDLCNVDRDRIKVPDDNIVLPNNIDFSGVENIYNLTLKFKENYTDNKEVYEEFFGLFGKKEYRDFTGDLKGYTCTIILQSDARKRLSISDSGVVSYGSGPIYDSSYEIIDSKVKKKNIYQSGGLDEIVAFPSGNTCLGAIIDDFNKWYCEGPFEQTFVPVVRTAYVLPLADGYDMVSLSAMLKLEGMFLDYYGGRIEMTQSGVAKVTRIDNFVNVSVVDRNEYNCFLNNGFFDIMEKEKIDQVVDFQTAVNILCEKIAGFNKLKIVEVEPLYVMEPQYSVENNEYFRTPGNIVKTIPVYSFMIRFDNPMQIAITHDIIESNDYCFINVSMIDGSVSTNLDERGYMYK